MERIMLKIKAKEEYAPRYYQMTGGEFKEMLAAVKALENRRFEDSPIKAWHIRLAGLEELGQQYTIELEPNFRLTEFHNNTVQDWGDEIGATAYFEYRSPEGSWRGGPSRLIGGPITQAEIEAEQARLDASFAEHFPDITASPASRYQAVRSLTRKMVSKYGAKIVAAFDAATSGERTEDAIQAGFTAVKKAMEA